MRCLLSRSVEPKQNRAGLMEGTSPLEHQDQDYLDLNHQATAAYHDGTSRSYSSAKHKDFQLQSTYFGGAPLPQMTKFASTGPNYAPELCSRSQRTCRSNHNQSVGPNDDTTSQLSSCRQRRAQYHRMLTAGKVDEVERAISIEI